MLLCVYKSKFHGAFACAIAWRCRFLNATATAQASVAEKCKNYRLDSLVDLCTGYHMFA